MCLLLICSLDHGDLMVSAEGEMENLLKGDTTQCTSLKICILKQLHTFNRWVTSLIESSESYKHRKIGLEPSLIIFPTSVTLLPYN